jgi:methionyl-tRNA formyltransferase
VITRPPARRGRGKTLYPSPVAEVAARAGVEVAETTTLKSTQIGERIAAVDADLGVVVAYGGLIPPAVLQMPTHGWVNLHFSDLPRWRGAAPVQWAIREGDATTASCVFRLEEGLDTGDVYSRVEVRIGRESAGELLDAMAQAGASQVLDVVDGLQAGTAVAVAQSETGITHARRLEHADGYVSFTRSAEEEDRIIRSVTPNPGAYTMLPGGTRMKLGVATPVERDDLEPGQLEITKKQVSVGCSGGALVLGQIAPAGKSWMDAAAWARGARPDDTMRFGGVMGDGQ